MKTHARWAPTPSRAPWPTRTSRCPSCLRRQIALHHHERWDGSGYPDGLAGDAIPLAARLMAVADVFDALISRRVYKTPMSFDATRALMLAQRGLQFDPDLIDAFVGLLRHRARPARPRCTSAACPCLIPSRRPARPPLRGMPSPCGPH
jgi:putative two-component system response regulator